MNDKPEPLGFARETWWNIARPVLGGMSIGLVAMLLVVLGLVCGLWWGHLIITRKHAPLKQAPREVCDLQCQTLMVQCINLVHIIDSEQPASKKIVTSPTSADQCAWFGYWENDRCFVKQPK